MMMTVNDESLLCVSVAVLTFRLYSVYNMFFVPFRCNFLPLCSSLVDIFCPPSFFFLDQGKNCNLSLLSLLTIPRSLPSPSRSWNEWLRLQVKYPDLPQSAQVALTVWDVYGPGRAVPVGGTTVTLFGKYG